MRYIIVYTNDKIVQGHRVYWSASKVNILSQWKVQGLMPTYPMQLSIVEYITISSQCFSLKLAISFMWEIVGKI